MQFKLNRKHLDYLYWLFPLIFMALAFFEISRDKQNRASNLQTIKSIRADSSIIINSKLMQADSLTKQAFDVGIGIPLSY
jgi:hypothetical protein